MALGLKFKARGVLECYEGDLEDNPFCRRRDIEFRMVEGDFQTFEGRWHIEQVTVISLKSVTATSYLYILYALHLERPNSL